MGKIAQNYAQLLLSIEQTALACNRKPGEIKLVAVTKNHSAEEILELYNAGCRCFGENRIQEALSKFEKFPADLRWHLIGSLQKNKVRKAIGCFELIESVDSPELAEKISEVSRELEVSTPILLQVNVSGEATKHGLDPEEWIEKYRDVSRLPGISIEGLMTMAPLTENKDSIRRYFAKLRRLRDSLPGIGSELSMGMSNDYKEAIAEGATILRIGSALFS